MTKGKAVRSLAGILAAAALALAGSGQAAEEPAKMSEGATAAPADPGLFRDDPSYDEKPYEIERQLEIYGGKSAIPTPRPLLEGGREIYQSGPLQPSYSFLGELNPVAPALAIYGDIKAAVGYNDNGEFEIARAAVQANIDVDLKLTGTERFHAFFQPLNQGANFTRCDFGGDDDGCEEALNINAKTFFFEGDLGQIVAGVSGEPAGFDLPFAVGLFPLLVQNGIWIEDAFTGLAATLPARNFPSLDISNMDLTLFAAVDKVSSAGVLDTEGKVADHNVHLYGGFAFIEALQGFTEVGYAYTDGQDGLDDQSYHSLTAAFSKRYFDRVSNSFRVLWSFGQDRDGNARQNADGVLFLIESSLVTSRPTTLVPYLNLFAGFDRPQSLARDGAAGGVLENTGINFETDNLTAFPKLDDTANNTYGGALGVSYLFGLDQQIVVEVATVQTMRGDGDRVANGPQYALGVRWQKPLTKAWNLRADAMAAAREDDEDLFGVRLEIKRKF